MVSTFTDAELDALYNRVRARAGGGPSAPSGPAPSGPSRAPTPGDSSCFGKGCLIPVAILTLIGATLGVRSCVQKRAERAKEAEKKAAIEQRVDSVASQQMPESVVDTRDPKAVLKAIYDQKLAECYETGDMAGVKRAKQEYEDALKEFEEKPSVTNEPDSKPSKPVTLTPEQAARAVFEKEMQRCVERGDQEGIRNAIENLQKTLEKIQGKDKGKDQASKPKGPMTKEQRLCAAAEARDIVVTRCMEKGDFSGAAQADREFMEYCRGVLKGMTEHDALTTIDNARVALEMSAESSESALTITRNVAEMQDVTARSREVDPVVRQADAAEARARGAYAHNSEVKWNNDTLNEVVKTPKRVLDGLSDDADAFRRLRDEVRGLIGRR